MRNEIEKAIRETLVIENKESIHVAVDKVNNLLLEALEKEFKDIQVGIYDEDGYIVHNVDGREYYETEVKIKYK